MVDSNWPDSNDIDIRNPFLPCRKLNSSSQVLHWSNRHLGNDCIDSLSWSKVSTMFERISSVWLEPPSSSFSCSSMYPNLKCQRISRLNSFENQQTWMKQSTYYHPLNRSSMKACQLLQLVLDEHWSWLGVSSTPQSYCWSQLQKRQCQIRQWTPKWL